MERIFWKSLSRMLGTPAWTHSACPGSFPLPTLWSSTAPAAPSALADSWWPPVCSLQLLTTLRDKVNNTTTPALTWQITNITSHYSGLTYVLSALRLVPGYQKKDYWRCKRDLVLGQLRINAFCTIRPFQFSCDKRKGPFLTRCFLCNQTTRENQ